MADLKAGIFLLIACGRVPTQSYHVHLSLYVYMQIYIYIYIYTNINIVKYLSAEL